MQPLACAIVGFRDFSGPNAPLTQAVAHQQVQVTRPFDKERNWQADLLLPEGEHRLREEIDHEMVW